MARSNFSGAWGHNLQLEIFSAWNTPNVEENCARSEERRVGKECRSRWSPYH